MRIAAEKTNSEVVSNEVVNSCGHSTRHKSVAVCSGGAIDMNEISVAIRPDTPTVSWAWLRGRRWCFSFDAFTFDFFAQRSWWWRRRWSGDNTLLDLEHAIVQSKAFNICVAKTDFIKRRQFFRGRIDKLGYG